MHYKKGFAAQFYHEGLRVYVGQCATKDEARRLAQRSKAEYVKDPKSHPLYKMNMDATWQHFVCSDEMRESRKIKLSDLARPEVPLRLAVLEQALVDMRQVSSWVASANAVRKTAYDWIDDPETGLPSFTFNSIVEDILGVDAGQARTAILKKYHEDIASGEIEGPVV